MNEQAKRAYHHGSLAEALLQEALEVTRSDGPEGISVRDLARRVGVSPNAVYRHFADLDALRAELALRLQLEIASRMDSEAVRRRRQDDHSSARAALRGVGLGYIEFAITEPGWFAVAFADVEHAAPEGAPTELPPPLAHLVDALDRLVAAGELAPDARAGAEWPCWSAVHGFAMLVLHGPLRGRPTAELRAAAERTVDAIIAGVLADRGGHG